MAVKDKNEGIHGEEEKTPRFGGDYRSPNSSGGGVYDDQKTTPAEQLERIPTAPQEGIDHLRSKHKKSAPADELKKSEEAGASEAKAKVDEKEQGLYSGPEKERFKAVRRFKGRIGKVTRRKTATLAIVGLLGGGGILGFNIVQGPMQMIHFSQHLLKHFRSNQDFGNDRTSKVLIYNLLGKGHYGRLGITGNVAANKWEKRLRQQTGLQPVYSEGTKRFIGFEIADESVAHDFLRQAGAQDTRAGRKVEESFGKGARIDTAAAINKDTKFNPRDHEGKPLNGNTRIIFLGDVNFADRRAWTKTITQATDSWRISSAVGYRVLIKRFGIDMHPMNKIKNKSDQNTDAFKQKREERKQERTTYVEKGIAAAKALVPGKTTANDGSEVTNTADAQASDETKSFIEDFKNSGVIKPAGSAAVAVGVLCTVKGFGNEVDVYQQKNVIEPMVRLGSMAISSGEQTKSNMDFSLASLEIESDYLYDKQKKSSWTNAEAVRADQGKTGGEPMPEEAKLSNVGKPGIFNIVDDIPGLGGVCGVIDTVSGWPVISNVSALASGIMSGLINVPLGAFGTDTDKLMESALKAAAGKAVDANAKGAPYGNLASAGAFLASNDQAITTGGAALSKDQIAAIREEEFKADASEMQTKSIASRYLDPYSNSSLIGAAFINAPSSTSHAASSLANPIKMIANSFSSLFSVFNHKVSAATGTGYDYGIPKYGFSLEHQSDPQFEDPYEIAKKVEPELSSLNEKYDKCFNMSVTADESGVHIQSQAEPANIFKIQKEYPECDPAKNTDNLFNHYRFYLADAVTAISLACYEGDNAACDELGANGTSSGVAGASAGAEAVVSGVGGEKIAAVAEAEYKKNGNRPLETCGENCGPEVKKYTGGPQGPGAPWCAWFVSWIYREAGYEFKGAPANADGNIPAVSNLVAWFNEHGILFSPSDGKYKPQPGDVIMYGGSTHTGVVVKVSGDNIETVEGNTSGDGSFNANGETVGRKSFNYKTYNSRSIQFGRLKSF